MPKRSKNGHRSPGCAANASHAQLIHLGDVLHMVLWFARASQCSLFAFSASCRELRRIHAEFAATLTENKGRHGRDWLGRLRRLPYRLTGLYFPCVPTYGWKLMLMPGTCGRGGFATPSRGDPVDDLARSLLISDVSQWQLLK